ncbi:glycerophosphodiester phosphodiesterase family protein [Gordonia sp. (in: high G+C Gram-positive bacteria)]|jgi:glycerophosphoryl diester phosphodiesterase|uniref:glycerophosphodiester phosphodiesterase n=1 Tax=Gordonia sp. (in: high G+C Gram-positive bacteria) TaxID=84139 RepID=UPI00260AA3B1|nr:glycerophosphodiester phosphodiesterase family protein [Gordonia sp. (in: high G+C Gram-positive bacteria)]HMS75175.1 glycerophosphodiester phosphodiesterase family protein [Gordonia sp. (in: high G+C Gram-positive bacteria)]HQV17917.1 glycerophosphodiester phosphodiesterase family protein [Gordonia sp. (in: high G+C Gram-positive bacteria)]
MNAPTTVVRDGHVTRIKWHRARRRAADPVFTATRIREGMTVGASVEIDLVVHADRGFAVLHDLDVAHATTGRGNVRTLGANQLRAMSLVDNRRRRIDEPVLLLEDLADALRTTTIHPDALLQLDFKETASALDDRALQTFADAVAPIARHMILSCGDAVAVSELTSAAPGIRVGYDPCHDGAVKQVLTSGRFDEFVANAVDASPRAEMVYLDKKLVLRADDRGVDLIGAFHAAGRTVDTYTVRRVNLFSRRTITRLLALQADQITTDDPERLVARFA